MIRVCGWCGEDIQAGGVAPTSDEPVSHGLCPACLREILDELDALGGDGPPVPLETFLDALEAPVLLVTEDVEVRKTNTRARALAGKDDEALRGLFGGEVFDCVYASMPEGCGRTVHCSGCTIRRSVGHTFATGEPLERIPATIRRGARETSDTEIYVTTRKVEDRVLLRIDPA